MRLDTRTGAAWKAFLVNTAAALMGELLVITARSRSRGFFLTPACIPETRKFLGYVPDVGMKRTLDGAGPDDGGKEDTEGVLVA